MYCRLNEAHSIVAYEHFVYRRSDESNVVAGGGSDDEVGIRLRSENSPGESTNTESYHDADSYRRRACTAWP